MDPSPSSRTCQTAAGTQTRCGDTLWWHCTVFVGMHNPRCCCHCYLCHQPTLQHPHITTLQSPTAGWSTFTRLYRHFVGPCHPQRGPCTSPTPQPTHPPLCVGRLRQCRACVAIQPTHQHMGTGGPSVGGAYRLGSGCGMGAVAGAAIQHDCECGAGWQGFHLDRSRWAAGVEQVGTARF